MDILEFKYNSSESIDGLNNNIHFENDAPLNRLKLLISTDNYQDLENKELLYSFTFFDSSNREEIITCTHSDELLSSWECHVLAWQQYDNFIPNKLRLTISHSNKQKTIKGNIILVKLTEEGRNNILEKMFRP